MSAESGWSFCNARMIVKWTILCIGYIRTFIFISLQGCIKKARKTPNNVNEESKLKRKSYNRYEKSNKESFTPDAAPRRDSTQRNATQSVWTLSAYSMCLIKAKFHYAIQLASRSLARLRPAREPAECVASRCVAVQHPVWTNLKKFTVLQNHCYLPFIGQLHISTHAVSKQTFRLSRRSCLQRGVWTTAV